MYRIGLAGAAIVGLMVAAITANAGGTSRDELGAALRTIPSEPTTSDSGAPDSAPDGAVTGTLDPSAPATHAFKLAAGEAVRMWAVPTSGEMAQIDYPEPFAEMSLGVAVDPTEHARLWESVGWNPSEPGDSFFSDYTDPALEAGTEFDISPYGLVVVYTSGGASADFNYQLDPPFFSCADRGLSEFADQGAWLAFIAPYTATYTVVVVGVGGYELHVETQLAPPEVPSDATAEFPYTGPAYGAVIDSHWEFLFEQPFYPTDELFSDGDYYESEERCRGLENEEN